MPKKIYRCEPCNYEYEHLYFDTVPMNMQRPIPSCPVCEKELTHQEQEKTEYYYYRCWASEGGCGAEIDKMLPKDSPPEKIACPNCGNPAKLGVHPSGFSIVHGNSMTKGASVDVAIGRNSEQRWNKIYQRKESRDNLRKETGTSALSIIEKNGQVFGSPIKNAKLEPISVPENKVNVNEKHTN